MRRKCLRALLQRPRFNLATIGLKFAKAGGNIWDMKRPLFGLAAIIISAFSLLPFAFAQGTAFTYQGQLNETGNPANGNYDFQFAVYDSSGGGTRIAGPLTNSAVAVSNGLFTVTLDFGPGVFAGNPRFLDIGVRPGGSANAFTILSPRQPLTPAPYSIFANTASNLSGTLPAGQLEGTLPASAFAGYTNTVALTNGGNLFSGSFSGSFVGAFNGAFIGNGGNVTNVNVTHLTGVLADNQLPSNTAFVNSNQTFSGNNYFTGSNTFTNLYGNSFSGSFFGNGLVGWIPTNGTAVQATIDTGYLLTNSQLVTVTLPASAHPGDIVRISGAGASGWKVAQNAAQSILGNFTSLAKSPWTPSGASPLYWRSIASSSDGSRLVAAASSTGGGIYISIDSGLTWAGPYGNLSSATWYAVASSADGTKVPTAVYGGDIYTNSGTTWTAALGSANWTSLASSADGTKLIAAAYGSGIYVSSNSGGTWSGVEGSANWISVASSSDGTKLIAAISGGAIWGNSSGSWQQEYGTPASGTWSSVASSADGSKLVAVANGGGIYTSVNSGGSWSPQTSGLPASAAWTSVTSSSDGSKLAAVVSGGGIYTSSNFGVTWAQQTNVPTMSWNAIVSSADGTRLAAAINNATTGGIYVSQASSQTTTTVGTSGYIIGGQGSAVELQYIGNNQFMPVSFAGNLWAY